jgi:N-acetylmuramoyl-L-alanine amidase
MTRRQCRLVIAAALMLSSCAPCARDAPPGPDPGNESANPSGWPYPDAAVRALPFAVPSGFGKKRVFIDAGHGVAGNTGPASILGELEDDFDLRIANDLGARLNQTESFDVLLSRNRTSGPTYPMRSARAESWGADAIISIHFDNRYGTTSATPLAKLPCGRLDRDAGYAVLFADNAESALTERRRRLAVAITARMTQAGFLPYSGIDYQGLYEPASGACAVFIDRHPKGQRIFMLNRTTRPAVIIETHQGTNREEVLRWHEEATLRAFGAAVALALVDVLAARTEALVPDSGQH